MKFTSKQMEQEKNLTLSEVTQAQKTKDKYAVYSFICAY